MSKFAAYATKANAAVMNLFGDNALIRIRGHKAVPVRVAYDLRAIQVFEEATGSAVEEVQVWFWVEHCSLPTKAPAVGDEILFEGRAYNIVNTEPLGDGGMWVRTHQAETQQQTSTWGDV